MHDLKTRSRIDVADYRPTAQADAFTAADIRRFMARRRWAIFLPILLSLIGAYAFNRLAIPMYNARAQIIIDPRLPQFIPGHNEESVLAWDTAQVESEIAVISSERIAGSVVKKLSLDTSNDFRNAPSWSERLLATLERREPVTQLDADRFRMSLGLIENGLSVRRTGLSYAIDINFTYPDPLRATEIANGVAEAYISDQVENRSQAARLGGEWLQQRMVFLRSQMNAAAKAVQIFRSSHNYQIPRPEPVDGTAQTGGGVPEAQTLDELEASAATYRRIYESFLQSYTESVQRQSFPVSDARLLTKASLPKFKSSPRTILVFALAFLVGTLLGFGFAILLEHLDRNIRTVRQAADLTDLPAFGDLPRPRRSAMAWIARCLRRLRGRRRQDEAGAFARQIQREVGHRLPWRPRFRRSRHFLTVLDQPDAAFGQALRTVKVLTDITLKQHGARTLGIAAPHRGAGTSLLASNIAALGAAYGKRTLLIDADPRRRTLTKAMRATSHPGLSDVLAQEAACADAIIRLGSTPLDFMPAGVPTLQDGFGAQDGDSLRSMFDALAASYDLVIVDLPPLLPVSNGLVLAASLDCLLLVIEAGKTSTTMVTGAQSHLSRAQAALVGFVLTNATL